MNHMNTYQLLGEGAGEDTQADEKKRRRRTQKAAPLSTRQLFLCCASLLSRGFWLFPAPSPSLLTGPWVYYANTSTAFGASSRGSYLIWTTALDSRTGRIDYFSGAMPGPVIAFLVLAFDRRGFPLCPPSPSSLPPGYKINLFFLRHRRHDALLSRLALLD